MATIDLSPNGAGASTAWTANGAATNWECVTADDGDTTYISKATGGYDLYAISHSALKSNSIVTGVTVKCIIRREAGGVNVAVAPYIRVSAAEWLGNSITITGSGTDYELITFETFAFNPTNNKAWTRANISNLQIGVSRGTAAVTTRITQVYVTITFTLIKEPINAMGVLPVPLL